MKCCLSNLAALSPKIHIMLLGQDTLSLPNFLYDKNLLLIQKSSIDHWNKKTDLSTKSMIFLFTHFPIPQYFRTSSSYACLEGFCCCKQIVILGNGKLAVLSMKKKVAWGVSWYSMMILKERNKKIDKKVPIMKPCVTKMQTFLHESFFILRM